MKKISLIVALIVLALLLLIIGASLTIIQEGQYGIITTPQKQTLLKSGIHWVWPWQSTTMLTVNQQTSYFELDLPQSSDNLQLSVAWKVQDIDAFLKANESADQVLNLLKAQTVTLLTPGFLSKPANPADLANAILQSLQNNPILNQAGIAIVQVWIKGVVPNDAHQTRIFNNMKGLASIIAGSMIQNGQTQAEQIRDQAEQNFLQAQSAALNDAAQILGQGNSAAVQMMAPLYHQNPALFKSYVAAKAKLLANQAQSSS